MQCVLKFYELYFLFFRVYILIYILSCSFPIKDLQFKLSFVTVLKIFVKYWSSLHHTISHPVISHYGFSRPSSWSSWTSLSSKLTSSSSISRRILSIIPSTTRSSRRGSPFNHSRGLFVLNLENEKWKLYPRELRASEHKNIIAEVPTLLFAFLGGLESPLNEQECGGKNNISNHSRSVTMTTRRGWKPPPQPEAETAQASTRTTPTTH